MRYRGKQRPDQSQKGAACPSLVAALGLAACLSLVAALDLAWAWRRV